MTDVRFALGDQPALSAYDAGWLARFLELGKPDEAATRLAGKIRSALQTGDYVDIDHDDLGALARLFDAAPELHEPEFGLRQLQREVEIARG